MKNPLLKKALLTSAVALALAYAAGRLSPTGPDVPLTAVASIMPVMLLTAVIFLRALKRHEDLSGMVATELNKIRRLYHLGKNLAGDNEKLRGWFTELHGFVYGYLSAFDKKDFSRYQETNGDFRKLSYHLYTIPSLETEKERVLYRELLDAAGEVAGTRQRIQDLWAGGLKDNEWHAFNFITGLAAVSLLYAIGAGDWIHGGLLLAVVVVSVSLVKDIDQMKTIPAEALSKNYVENMARLELRR
jgi:hypothetical protein